MKETHGSLRKASIACNINWKSFHGLCKPPIKKVKQVRQTWIDIWTFYMKETVFHELPNIRTTGWCFLNKTLEESYSLYKEDCLKTSKKVVCFSTFCKLCPKNVFKISQMPDCQCICDVCENFRLLRCSFKMYKIQGIEAHTDTCIKQNLCKVSDYDDSNARDVTDGLHQVDPAYGYFECITRNCKKCGPDNILLSILQQNPDIENCKSEVSWDHWEWVPKKKDLEIKWLDIVTHHGSKKQLIDQYIHDLHAM